MAIDFLIFGLLLISFIINLLALGAFWVTPGLRTTANRFTINLLIINLIGCLILAPTLFLTGSSFASNNSSELEKSTASRSSASSSASATATLTAISDDRIEFLSKPGNHQMTIRHNGKLVEQDGILLRHNYTLNAEGDENARTIETIYKCNSTYCQELTIDENSDTIVITEIEEENRQQNGAGGGGGETTTARSSISSGFTRTETAEELLLMPIYGGGIQMRCWSIDMTAALGALAVLLVVGDTWCAVTDPLRYHSRISGVKTWVFIALTWVMGILFGALSALRELDFETGTLLSKRQRFLDADTSETVTQTEETSFNFSNGNGIFSMIFASLYFIVIILLPFGFVCGMYWRIFSEARENGLRMRANGSSPLLQSALNLTHHQQSSSLQYSNSLCVHRASVSSASSNGGTGGLQMQIDHQRKSSPACLRRDSAAKVLLPTISDDGVSDADISETAEELQQQLVVIPANSLADRNQNILLTLQAASGEIKRNYSARQLPLLGTSSQDLRETHMLQGIRQVHSSPNLHKFTQLRQDSLSDESGCSPHLLGHHQMLHPEHVRHHPHRYQTQQQQHQLHCFHNHNNQHLQHVSLHHAHHTHALQIPAIHASPKALSYMSSLRHRLSNASSLFKYREESRAARISILVVIMFLVSYLPFGFLVLLQSRIAAANFTNSSQLAIFMILLGNLSSPFIFAYRNKRVRRGVKRLFGLDKRSRERAIQRQSSSSGRGSGFLNRPKSTGNIKRNISKVSTYSLNSCKYLTPQSSVVSNGMPASTHAKIGTLRQNSSCSTIINFGGYTKATNDNNTTSITAAATTGAVTAAATTTTATTASADDKSADELQLKNQRNNNCNCNGNNNNANNNRLQVTPHRATRPTLQRGITIVEQLPPFTAAALSSTKFAAKRSLFKMFFQSSKNLGCVAATQSCAQGSADAETEPTEV